MHNHAQLAALLTRASAHKLQAGTLRPCSCRERRSKQNAAARKRRRLNDQAQHASQGPPSAPAPAGQPVPQEASPPPCPPAPPAGLTPRLQQGIAQLAAAHAAGMFPAQEDAVAASCLVQLWQGQLSPASPSRGPGAQPPGTPKQAKQAAPQQPPSKPRQGRGKQQACSAKHASPLSRAAPPPATLKPAHAKAGCRTQAASSRAEAPVKAATAGRAAVQRGEVPQAMKRMRDDQGLNPMKKHPKRRRSVPASSQKPPDKVPFLSSAAGHLMLAVGELLWHKGAMAGPLSDSASW